MESDYIDDLEKLDNRNFWFKAKERYLDFIIRKPGAAILDVGCGSGRNMISFIARGFKVTGIDISERAVTLCAAKGYKVLQADLERETAPDIYPAPDYVTVLDFLEHVKDPVKVLSNLRKLSHSDTQLIVTVPAYQFLFSEWDRAMGHVKRYNRAMLCDEMEEGGWEVSRATYVHFVPLIPTMLLRKIILPVTEKIRPRDENEKNKFFNPHPAMNWLLFLMYYPELSWFRMQLPLPAGMSVLAIATPKKVAAHSATAVRCNSPSQITRWRESIARRNGTIAVVLGSFSILQPGNLFAIREAKSRANDVCVIIAPDDPQTDPGLTCDPPAKRAEFVSLLRDVSATCTADACGRDLERLRPYILVDCLAQPDPSPLRQAARAAAESVADIPAMPGCFTRDISRAIQNSQTPVEVPARCCPSVPTAADLDRVVSGWRKQGEALVTVNGCFDLLHMGHLRMLSEARRMGHELIVLVNDDASVRAYKGKGRPIFPIHFRLQALSALGPVSLAYPFSGDNPLALLSAIRPDIHVKGGTFEQDRVRQERELLESWGGRIEFCSMVDGYSTTRLIQAS